ncbi:MAG: hypothetical protein WCG85_26690 [Polyangia bacterium]
MLTTDKRRLLRFAVLFLLLFALLAWPFPFVGRGYRSFVSSAVDGLVFSSAHTHVARLVPNQRPGFAWYLTTEVWNQVSKSVEAHFDVDVHHSFCLPTAVFIALTLAGKFTWGARRIVLKLLIGILLLQLLGAVRFIALERSIAGIQFGAVDLFLMLVNRSLAAPLGMAFAVPLILWFGLFRKSFLQAWDGSASRKVPPPRILTN